MGNCGSSINCTAVNQPVEANPDVAGIGVLVSFVASAVITFIAIVFGYLSDSLPDSSLSQLDRACIAKLSTIRWRPWIKDGRTSLLLRRSMTVAMGVLRWNYAVAGHNEGLEDDDTSRNARERRSKGLKKFILALSDQQLVTGLAVLIAGYISPCSMSMYHFNIIAALGWFSSTVHLSTLAVLRVYFIEHPRLRNWRVSAMLLVLTLLITAQVINFSSTRDNSLPLRCVSSPGFVGPGMFNIMIIVMFLGVTYSDRIVRLYSLDPNWSLLAWSVDGILLASKRSTRLSELTEIAIVCSKLPQVEQDKIRRKLKERQQYIGQELVKIAIESSKTAKAEQGVLWQSMNERRRYITHYDKLGSRRSGWRRRFRSIVIMMTEINYSFLGDLLTLLFGVVYGITQIIISRVQKPSDGIVGSENYINFGQIVPLLLMLLPLFAAGEVYFERREDMLTKPSLNLTHKKPFFSRKIGLADIFRLSHSTQPSSDNTQDTVDTSSLLQSPGSVSRGVGGNNWIEFQNLPTGRLRRPDTETGLRAPTTDPSQLARSPSRIPVPEIGIQPEQTTKKPPSLWRTLTPQVAAIMILQTLLAIALGGVSGGGLLSVLGFFVIVVYVCLNGCLIISDIVEKRRNSANA